MDKIQRTISYNDLSSFLPDNLTALNKNYWEKHLDGINDGYPELLEALSRVEYNDEYIKHIENKIKNNTLEFNARIEKELIARANLAPSGTIDRKNEITDLPFAIAKANYSLKQEDEINLLNAEIKNMTLIYNDK